MLLDALSTDGRKVFKAMEVVVMIIPIRSEKSDYTMVDKDDELSLFFVFS